MRVICLFYVLICASGAYAGNIDPVVVAPPEPSQAGKPIVFSVYLHNANERTERVDIPENVTCNLKFSNQMAAISARLQKPTVAETISVKPSGYAKVQYKFIIPDSVKGTVRMDIPSFKSCSVVFEVHPTRFLSKETLSVSSDTAEKKEYESLDELFALYQPYLGNIAAYEPMYFLVGTDPEKSKFQISFKYRFLNPGGSLARRHPWVTGFHFGYTQTSFWNLNSASMPFEDTSYKPEIFFESSSIETGLSGVRRFFVQTGFQHESNGRGGEYSRSTNFLYFKPIFIVFSKNSRFGLQFAPKMWAYIANDDDTNSDLADYRGYFDFELKFGKADSFVLGSHLRWAGEGGSMELDLTYPLHQFSFQNLDLYFQAQYVNSLAESLLHYKDREEAFRLGISIVR